MSSRRYLWLGALNGLYTYQLQSRKLTSFDTRRNGLPNNTIYTPLSALDNQIYVGTYNGLCHISRPTLGNSSAFLFHPYAVKSNCSSILLEDTTCQCVHLDWLRSFEGYISNTIGQSVDKTDKAFHNNSIKSLAWMETDYWQVQTTDFTSINMPSPRYGTYHLRLPQYPVVDQ